MKRILTLTPAIAVLAALCLAFPLWAQPMGPTGGAAGRMHGHGGLMGSGLTPDQQQTMQKITDAHKPALTKLSQKLWAKEIQLQAALTEDKIDDGKVKALSGEINRLHSDLFNEQVAMKVELAKAGLSYYALRGRHMMGAGMMGDHMDGSCPMMDGGGMPGGGGTPGQ